MDKIGDYLLNILDWSEVWAMMIPLSVLLFYRQQSPSLRPVVVFVWLGFLVNIAIDVIMAINLYLPGYPLTNNPLYNVQSIIRLSCFSFYFLQIQRDSFRKTKIVIGIVAALFVLVNFLFFERFVEFGAFSSNLFTSESYVLLIYCMLFYIAELKDDASNLFYNPHFWIVTGLSIYVVINFFVFLFYQPMVDMKNRLALDIWNVHNIAFVVFCLFLTKAFYGSARYQYSV